MIGRLLALPGVAIDQGPGHPRRDGFRGEDEIDPHPATLMEVTAPVIPVAIQMVIVVDATEGVDHAPILETLDRRAFCFGDVGGSLERSRRPDISVVGRNVEVAGDDQGVGGRVMALDPFRQALEPDQLAVVELAGYLTAVRNVHTDDPDSSAGGREHARIALVRVDDARTEPVGRVLETDA